MADLYGKWTGIPDKGLGRYLSSVHKPSEYPSQFYSSTALLQSSSSLRRHFFSYL